LPKLGLVDDIAEAALFLAGDAARLTNGHNLIIDGGITAGWPAVVARGPAAVSDPISG
jgi:NAD(P)-dependent dehydrogenase (short-subunit alcohol dehydrogenase family)